MDAITVPDSYPSYPFEAGFVYIVNPRTHNIIREPSQVPTRDPIPIETPFHYVPGCTIVDRDYCRCELHRLVRGSLVNTICLPRESDDYELPRKDKFNNCHVYVYSQFTGINPLGCQTLSDAGPPLHEVILHGFSGLKDTSTSSSARSSPSKTMSKIWKPRRLDAPREHEMLIANMIVGNEEFPLSSDNPHPLAAEKKE